MKPATTAAAILVPMATACGSGETDSAQPDTIVECEAIECPTADSEEASKGSRFASVTCRWSCTDYDGVPRAVTATWTREAGECFALTNRAVQDCAQ